ncbi:MAG TPA: glycosyltransferase family 1 protein [Candidatus Woesebacteria bacterium]|nr:glycosyltransferase family 1 protein [Candidatus Woesebacteria bacterium]
MKYKIAIDVSPLSDGNSKRGVGYYTKNLVDSIQKEIKNSSEFKVDLIDKSNTNLDKYDLIHYPFFDPFFLTLPKLTKPFVITVHDLIPIQLKKLFPVGIKGFLKWQLQKRQLQKASGIITVSHYSKYQIHNHTNFPLEKIFTTYEAANSCFKPLSNLNKIKSKYKLPNKFVFYVGDINLNKNIRTLVNACLDLSIPLVIAGSSAVKQVPDHPWTKDILWLQQQASLHQSINLLGFVPDEDLPSLYNLATIYCQPSYLEGFGLTVVEAMACGCPVIYSQESSLWEVMDFNGLFFDPYSVNDLKEKILKFWNNQKLRQQYSNLGLKRSKFFNWKFTAKETLNIYQNIILENK